MVVLRGKGGCPATSESERVAMEQAEKEEWMPGRPRAGENFGHAKSRAVRECSARRTSLSSPQVRLIKAPLEPHLDSRRWIVEPS